MNRTVLGHGAEFEFFEMLDLSAAIDLIEGATVETLPLAAQTYPLAADDAGTISIEVEKKDYYRDSQDGRLYRRPAPTRTRETVAIVEVVAGVVPDTDAEVGTHLADESLFPSIAAFENALSALTGPVRFADLLADFQATGHLTELRLTPVGERALIGPRPPDSDPGARVHHSIGVPLAGAYSFLAYVAAHTWRSPTSVAPSHARPHLDDALRFADALAARFAATGASARDVAELRGFAAMLYVNAAGYANRFIYRGGAKENLGAASRHDMAVLIEQLPAAARTFFTEGFTEVEGLFRAQFTARFPDLADRFRDRHGEELPGDFFQLPGGQTPTVVDYLAGRVSQRTAFGGMTVLPALDEVNAALPLVVLEVRYFGAQHVAGAAAQAEAEALREAARAAFSEALRVTGTVVLRSGAVTLPPDQRLWSLSRRTGRPGLLTVELPLNEQGWSLRPLLPMPADVTAIRVVQHVDLPEHFVALQRLADFTGRPVYALADDTAAVWDPDLRDVRVDGPDDVRPWLEFLPAAYEAVTTDPPRRWGIGAGGQLTPLTGGDGSEPALTVHPRELLPTPGQHLPPVVVTHHPEVRAAAARIQVPPGYLAVVAGPDAPTDVHRWAADVVEAATTRSVSAEAILLVGHPLPHLAAQTLADEFGRVADAQGAGIASVVVTHGADIEVSTRTGEVRTVPVTGHDELDGWRVFRPFAQGGTTAVPDAVRAAITSPATAAGPVGPGAGDAGWVRLHTDTGAALRDPDEPSGWAARRAAAPVAVRQHRWVDPVSLPGPGQHDRYVVESRFEVRRFEYDGQPVTDLTVRVWIDGDPAGEVLADLRDMVHLILNGDSHAGEDAYVLPNGHGDRLHVTVARATSADDAHLAVQMVDEGPTDQFHWRHDATPEQRLHEFAHQLGLRDEYRDSTSSHRPDVPGSLLGDLTGVASDALTSDELAQLSDEEEIQLRGMQWAGLRPRHLQLLAALIGEPDADGAYRGTAPTSERIGVAPRAPQPAIDRAGQPLPAVDTESGDVAAGEAGSERIEVSRRVDRTRHPLTPAGLETAVRATLDAQAAVRPADPAAP
ncbi:hypothetical protein AB0L22_32745, partial [Micromonospora haikouensis]|uniref:hypothetical protein n=1 Tax=Micromonospora haikouensis TaxID=686309 RepID=UPI00341BBA14